MDRDGVRVVILWLGAPGRGVMARQPLRKGLGPVCLQCLCLSTHKHCKHTPCK